MNTKQINLYKSVLLTLMKFDKSYTLPQLKQMCEITRFDINFDITINDLIRDNYIKSIVSPNPTLVFTFYQLDNITMTQIDEYIGELNK